MYIHICMHTYTDRHNTASILFRNWSKNSMWTLKPSLDNTSYVHWYIWFQGQVTSLVQPPDFPQVAAPGQVVGEREIRPAQPRTSVLWPNEVQQQHDLAAKDGHERHHMSLCTLPSPQPAVFLEDDADSQMPACNTGYSFTTEFKHFISICFCNETQNIWVP